MTSQVYNPYQASSCTIESAVQRLLGIPLHRTVQTWVESSDGEGELLGEYLDDVLRTDLEDAECAHQFAIDEKLAVDVIAAKLAELEQCKFRSKAALRYEREIIDELARLTESELRVDHLSTINPKYPLLTIASLERWSLKKYGLSVVDFENSGTLAEEFRAKNAAVDENYLAQQSVFPTTNQTWTPIDLVQTQVTTSKYGPFVSDYPISSAASDLNRYLHDPKDPAPDEEWYPAARYFAREYIAEHPKQKIKKLSLAPEVAKLMAEAKIFHTGNTPYAARTIRKAFHRVKF